MAKNPPSPPLTLVSPGSTGIAPPRALGPHGRRLWDDVQRSYGITDAGGVEILAQICGAVDVIESLGERIAADGVICYARNGVPRAHPAIKDQTALRALVCRGVERLGLNVEAVKSGPGRPAQPFGWIPPENR